MNYDSISEKYGFKVTRARFSGELGGTLVEMTHEKSGAQLCWLDNGASNKLFSIIFKTLPDNDTGVFHILEHSTLCGSKKYPVREPFVELIKGSMNTFLNALTWPDKTAYPVSSRNDEDYLNLMSVYMDAVFAPRFLDDPNIFYQEGWHIEQNDGELSYKGVVFNEMKGAMSDEGELVGQKIVGMLFPDNCYGCNSGGDPVAIPDLTYEQFVDTYKKYYHPSNSRVYLDGAIPLDKTLEVLDSYFNGYERSFDLPVLSMQPPIASEETIYYEIGPGQDMKNKGRLTLGKIIGVWSDTLKAAVVNVLNDVLAGSNEAPLKKAVLESGLAKKLTMSLDDSIAQHYFTLNMKDTKDGCDGELIALIRDTVRRLADEGLSREALNASINRSEFRVREPEEPQGLFRCFNAVSFWLHDGDPMGGMVYDELFEKLRAGVDSGLFEKVMCEMLLDESGLAVLHTLPSHTLGEEARKRERERLDAIKAAWTEADMQANALLNEKLVAWQKTPDTAQQLATLPVLELSAVSAEPEIMPTQVSKDGGVTMLYHPAPGKGVVHFSMYFDLADCTLDELSTLSVLPRLLGKLPTEKHDALELQQLVKLYVGRMDFSIVPYAKDGVTDRCTPYLVARCSVLEKNLPMAEALMAEILTSTQLDKKEQIRNIEVQADIAARRLGVSAGHLIGMMSALSHYSAVGAVSEAVGGRTGIRRLHEFCENFEERIDDVVALMQRVKATAIVKNRLVISSTAAERHSLAALISALPDGEKAPADAAYSCDMPMKTGCRIPAQASYAVQAMNLADCGAEYDAGFKVAAHILTYDYLWNAVRVQGGAYGVGLRVDSSGSIYAYSYRDPTPGATLGVYGRAADHIEALCAAGENIDKYIISTMAKFEPLMSPRAQGEAADSDWFAGITCDDKARMKREMLATDHDTLRRFAAVLRRFAAEGAVCVVGHEDALKACSGLTMLEI